MPKLEVDKVYMIQINQDDDKKWKFPSWVDVHNRYVFDTQGLYTSEYVQTPYKVIVKEITTDGIWVELFVPGEVSSRKGLMQLFWKDILVIEVE